MPVLLPAGAGARVPAFTPVPKPWFSQNDVNKDKYHLHTQWMCYRRGFLKLKRSDLVIGNKPGWNFARKEYIYYTAAAKSLQSCPTLRDPIDGSPPGSPVPGTLQARTLEWVAISFSNAGKWMKVKSLSRVRPSATPWTAAHQAPPSMGFSRQEYWSGVPLPTLDGEKSALCSGKTHCFYLPVLFIIETSLKKWSRTKEVNVSGHKMCRKAINPWRTVSYKACINFILVFF